MTPEALVQLSRQMRALGVQRFTLDGAEVEFSPDAIATELHSQRPTPEKDEEARRQEREDDRLANLMRSAE